MRVCRALARAASCTSVAVYTSCEGFERQYPLGLSVNRKSISGRKLYITLKLGKGTMEALVDSDAAVSTISEEAARILHHV